MDKRILNYMKLIILISFPIEIKCFDVEKCSSFILCLLLILFILALLGDYSLKRKGYKQLDDSIKLSTKL